MDYGDFNDHGDFISVRKITSSPAVNTSKDFLKTYDDRNKSNNFNAINDISRLH